MYPAILDDIGISLMIFCETAQPFQCFGTICTFPIVPLSEISSLPRILCSSTLFLPTKIQTNRQGKALETGYFIYTE